MHRIISSPSHGTEQEHQLETITMCPSNLSTWCLFSCLTSTSTLTIQSCDVLKEALASVPMSCNFSPLLHSLFRAGMLHCYSASPCCVKRHGNGMVGTAVEHLSWQEVEVISDQLMIFSLSWNVHVQLTHWHNVFVAHVSVTHHAFILVKTFRMRIITCAMHSHHLANHRKPQHQLSVMSIWFWKSREQLIMH